MKLNEELNSEKRGGFGFEAEWKLNSEKRGGFGFETVNGGG